ncbi:hypothetical protein ACFVMC_15260 [Nocardia sp. NPDC127579]|uniref:hypothetical protein n=1 Tax=Nocardia sp. NPDC127579 TaxID=3345402 RepID=UPI0036408644
MAGRTAILSVRIVGDGSDARRELERTSRAVSGFASTVHKVAAVTSLIAFAIGAVGNLGIGFVGLGLLAAPALAAIALGMEGIKQAAGAAAPALARLKQVVSETFAREMRPAFEQLAGLMDRITPAMQGIASAVSGVFSAVVGQLAGPGAAALDTLLAGAQKFIAALGSGLALLTQGLLDLGAAAAPVADKIGAAFGGVLGSIGEAFSRLAADGTLTRLFDGFAQALSGISAFLGPVVELFARLGAVVGPSLGGIFASLGTAIASITPAFERMAATIGGALVQALDAIVASGALPLIATALADVMAAVAPLIPPLAQLAGILAGGLAQLISALAPAWAAVAEALSGALVQILPTIADMFARLAPVIEQIATQIGTSLVEAITTLASSGTLEQLVQAFADLLVAVLPLLPTVARFAAELLPLVVQGLILAAPMTIALVNAMTSLANIVAGYVNSGLERFGSIVDRIPGWVSGAASAARTAFAAIASAIQTVVNAVQSLIGLLGSIRFPSPPSWLSRFFGGPAAELVGISTGADAFMRFLPQGFDTFAAPGPELAAAAPPLMGWAAAASAGPPPQITNVTINVSGAVDPQATALQIERMLRSRNITVGASAAIDLRVG